MLATASLPGGAPRRAMRAALQLALVLVCSMAHAAPSGHPQVIGQGRFEGPETVLWDPRRDVYLVSNVNGALSAVDDNGFISRIAPSGEVIDLKWIDGARPDTTLNGPKGMLLTDRHLVVADVHTLRFFDRDTGEPVREVRVPDSYLLNDLARGPDGTLYCSDTGDAIGEFPGGVYRFDDGSAKLVARNLELEGPDGLAADGRALLVAPFGPHANTIYRLSPQGERSDVVSLPHPMLDGLLRLPDGRLVATSWKGKAVYAIDGRKVEVLATGIESPAQIGYDAKRKRLLVPSLRQHEVLAYDLSR